MADDNSPLHIAAQRADVEEVRRLLTYKHYLADVTNTAKQTPLHLACANGQEDVVDVLVNEFNAPIDVFDINSYTPLLLGAKNNHLHIVTYLVMIMVYNNQACVVDRGHAQMLESMIWRHYQDSNSYKKVLQLLVSKLNIANVNIEFIPLFLAAIFGLEDLIDKFKENESGVNIKGFSGWSIFHCACMGGYFEKEDQVRDCKSITEQDSFMQQCLVMKPKVTVLCHSKMIDKLLVKYHFDPTDTDDDGHTPLHTAAIFGQLETVRHLIIKHNVETDIRNDKNNTPLCEAVLNGQIFIVKVLIEEFKCSPFIQSNTSQSFLHLACQSNSLQLIDMLIVEYQLNPMSKNDNGDTPLHIAAEYGQSHTVRHLITEYKVRANICNHQNVTPLFVAFFNNHIHIVKLLIKEFNCSPFAESFPGESLLHLACKTGNISLIDELVTECHLDPSAKDDLYRTPLHVAARFGKVEVIRHLITKYELIYDHHNNTLLRLAALNGQFDVVKSLIEEFNCSPFIEGFENQTLLHYACQKGNTILIDRLINEDHLHSTAKDNDGQTPLHIAAIFGQAEAIRHLVTKHNIKINVYNHQNDTPLSLAALNGQVHVVKILLEFNKCSHTSNGQTLLHLACQTGNVALVDMLIMEYHTECSAKDVNGQTPLHRAAKFGRVDTVRHLITKYSAKTDVHDYHNRTPLCLAAQNGQVHVVNVLIEMIGYSPVCQVLFNGRSLLHHACQSRNKELIDTLIEKYHLDPFGKDIDGQTPLHIAALFGLSKVVRHLIIKYMVNTEAYDHHNCTPLCLALLNDQTHIVRLLVSEFMCDPINLKKFNSQALFHTACRNGNIDLIQKLVIEHHVNPLVKDSNGQTPLHIAAISGQVNTIKHLITKCNIETNICNHQNDTPLNVAALNGQVDVVKTLIEEFNCSPAVKGFRGRNLIHCACQSGNLILIDLLIQEYYLDPSAKDDDGQTPLHIAAMFGQVDSIRQLIVRYSVETEPFNLENNSLIHVAALHGQVYVVKALIEEFNCDPLLKDCKGQTLLHYACIGNQPELVNMLIEDYQLELGVKDNEGKTPLKLACLFRCLKAITAGFQHLDQPSKDDNQIPFHSAAQIEAIKHLITKHNIEIAVCVHQSNTSLSLAALIGHPHVVKVILEVFNCSPVIEGQTLLHLACQTGNIDLIKMLITECHFDTAAKDDNGQTPLHIAARFGQVDTVRHLITEYKVETSTDYHNYSPLCLAAQNGQIHVVKVLIEEFRATGSVAINEVAFNGQSLLHHACQHSSEELIDMLVTEYHFNPCAKDKDGRTPLHIAATFGSIEVVTHLIVKYKVKTKVCDVYNCTPLCLALLSDQIHVAWLLINKFKCIPILNFRTYSLYYKACRDGNINLVNSLITMYNDDPVENFGGESSLKLAAKYGQAGLIRHFVKQNVTNQSQLLPPLCVAVSHGQKKIVKMLVKEFNCDPFMTGYNGWTLLHYACFRNQSELIRLLISDFQLDPGAKDNNGDTPLHIAYYFNKIDAMKLLISQYTTVPVAINPSTNIKNGTLLHFICRCHDDIEVIDILIAKFYFSPTAKDDNGKTPLHIAAARGHLRTVRLLIAKHQVDVDPRANDNSTPLCMAVLKGHKRVVLVLLNEFNCNPYVTGCKGWNLLHYASHGGHTEIANTLVREYRLDPLAKDIEGNTPLDVAKNFGQTARIIKVNENVKSQSLAMYVAISSKSSNAVQVLADQFNYSPYITGHRGWTLLHYACQYGQTALIDQLISQYEFSTEDRDDDDNTPLHIASMFGQIDKVKKLITEFDCKKDTYNSEKATPLCLATKNGHVAVVRALLVEFGCSPHVRDSNGYTLLHFASQGGCVELVDQLTEYKLDPKAKGEDGNTPLHIAAMYGQVKAITHLVVKRLVDIYETNNENFTPLFVAARKGQLQSVLILINDFNCVAHASNSNGQTLLHCACKHGYTELVNVLLTDFQLDQSVRDNDGNIALVYAVENGHVEITRILVEQHQYQNMNISLLELAASKGHHNIFKMLINEFKCGPNTMYCEGGSILHCACKGGHSELLSELITEYQAGSILSIDNDGNTPLHVSAMQGHSRCVNILLYEYKAPLFVRNKYGKTAYDIAKADQNQPIIRVIKEYLQDNVSQIQSVYQEIEKRAKQEFTGKKPLTRIFVVGHPEAGKSTLIETLKKEGRFSFGQLLGTGRSTSTVLPHTTGIVPSIYDTDKYGRVIFYDFAGDREYYSSHAAILENIDTSEGVNLYLVVCDLNKDDDMVARRYGYWLSFLSYNLQSTDAVSVILPIGSHADLFSDPVRVGAKVLIVNQVSQQFRDLIDGLYIEEGIALDCRKKGSLVTQVKNLAKKTSLSVPPVGLTLESSTLLGLLLKDFSSVPACTVGTVLSHIKETGIPLPTNLISLYPHIKELHNLGLLLVIEKEGTPIENHSIILKISTLTSDVHCSLFSKSGKEKLAKHIDKLRLSVGIVPESLLEKVLPEYVTKECLIKLQYCQEIENLLVEEDHTLTQSSQPTVTSDQKSLLFFPALCELSLEDIQWPSVFNEGCALGWYAKCADDRFDYFPTRFLHVLIVRLSLKFALKQNLPINLTSSARRQFDPALAELHTFNPRCHVWATGLHWLMKNGVKVFVDMSKDAESKEIVVVARSSNGYRAECANTLQKVVQTVIEAKVEFCHSILPLVYLLDPVKLKDEPFTNARNVPLYTLSDVEAALSEGSNVAVSVDGFHCSPPRDLTTLTRWTMSYWSKLPV